MSRATTLSLSFLLALFACTSDKTDTDVEDTNDTTDTTDDTMDTEDPPGDDDIVDVASGNADFSTLVDAVVQAGLEDTLRGDGPFTVFAPSNQAFMDLGVDLSTLTTEELSAILLYHVVPMEVPSGSIPAMAESANDLTLFFDTMGDVMVNDATVETPDLAASNGIIHAIDTVLMPPSILDAVGLAGLDGLGGAVGAADPAVLELLGGDGPFTVFAPDNDAFDAAASVTATLDTAGLTGVLSYHVFDGAVTSDIVPDRANSLLMNADGNPVTALFDTSAGVSINGTNVAMADIKTTNGIIHVIEDVLLPPTIIDHATTAGLTGLLDTVGAASGDLGTVLSGDGPFTVFAPTNVAFDDIAVMAAGLPPDDLRDILLFHVVDGDVVSSSLSSGEVPSLLTGSSLTVDVSNGVMVERASVVMADIHATNGTVHVIDTVMIP